MKVKIAQIQSAISADAAENLAQLERRLTELDAEQPDIVMTGEMFTCPYQTALFPQYAEPEGGETWQRLSDMARRHHIWLEAGSVPECDAAGRIYNTAYVFDREGQMAAKHRKVHLFDIQIKNGQHFRESDTLTAGDHATVFDTEFGRVGVFICFDIRFVELARIEVLQGAKLLLVPGAFNMTTGPAHWELSFRARALDNQCFIAGTSDARSAGRGYVSWGHSLLVSPWGEVIDGLEEQPGCLVNEIDLDEVEHIRRQLPILSARREDVYQLNF